ncbi:hypothetical protein BDB00DRAFT_828106 [Zychaea mexicana]|uniref:uncharacterized protein n=1 Tax=Zychaea mexicana TaxID=64656 RepID=UPI0022FE3F51|nr:uncharacterized protein BDB00DRAFT_828106 [Zychaea mexicana]KAI9492442.1 hypothetical protein BDB00DRAFT_828106 [Zychaea mexicana]
MFEYGKLFLFLYLCSSLHPSTALYLVSCCFLYSTAPILKTVRKNKLPLHVLHFTSFL